MMSSSIAYLEKIISSISSKSDKQRLIVDDISQMTRKVYKKLLRDNNQRQLNPLPLHYLVMSNEIVIDLKSKETVSIDEILSTYDIMSLTSLRYVPHLDSSLMSKISLYKEIVDRIFDDWSNNDKDVKKLLYQLIFAVLNNDNRNKCVVIKGPGGNGKSTFMKILSKIAGEENTIYANIHQFSDSNSINKISKSTRVIIGDDAATNHKLSDVGLSNLKSIVTGDPISVPVKYSENVVVKSNALFVQGTNTDINFYENNPALKSRMIVINWTDFDFRSQKKIDQTFNLDTLLEDQLFIDVIADSCINEIDYFDEFDVPQAVIDATHEMIESNDTLKQFLTDVYLSIDGFTHIPINVLYLSYQSWCKFNNPSGSVMKIHTFSKQLSKYSNEFGFKIADRNKRSRFGKNPEMSSLLAILDINVKDAKLDSQQLYISPNNPITSRELDNIKIDGLDLNDLSNRDYQILMKLAYEHHQTHVMSIINNLI